MDRSMFPHLSAPSNRNCKRCNCKAQSPRIPAARASFGGWDFAQVRRRCYLFLCVLSGCSFFAYSWKLPAYSGAFLLTIDKLSFFTYNWSFFAYNFSFFAYSWSLFAYNGKVRLIKALRDCKQRSLTVSKKAPTVSRKASPVFFFP